MQKCYNCGKEVDDNVLICPDCGALVKRYGRPESAQPEQEADLELMLKPAADPERELAPWPLLETEAEDAEPLRVDLPAPAPAKKPEPPRQSTAPVAEPAGQRSAAKTSRSPKNAPEVLLPQEEQEQRSTMEQTM